MNATVAAALERIRASIPAVTVPDAELGYGRDLDCVTDCHDDFREIGPDTARVILQALARRYQTPRGTHRIDLDYGLDLRGCLHKGLTQKELRMLQGQAAGEAKKDARIEHADITLTIAAGVLRVRAHIVPRDPRLAAFPGVIRITNTAVEIEG